MTDRDVDEFNARADRYDSDFLGRRFHRAVHSAAADVAAGLGKPATILDVGCGTGSLLALLGARFPEARLCGVDPAAEMLRVAHSRFGDDPRIVLRGAAAEKLPFDDGSFDLVVSSNSFHHWADQVAGLREIGRVLRADGHLVMTDPFAVGFRRWIKLLGWFGRMRTRSEMEAMLAGAGMVAVAWRKAGPRFVSSYFLIAAHHPAAAPAVARMEQP
jgi:ubiquinone/menaquinone biosynthesis C-methylase UbiE